MAYTAKNQREAIPPAINILLLVSLAGMALTAAQIVYSSIHGEILCLNEGCQIVERLTRVPPVLFNLAGALYFTGIFWFLWRGRDGQRRWLNLARLLLLAGMAAEGVLVAFQHYISEAFCSYCLVIFGCILLLNILAGARQLLLASTAFAAVLLAFSSLQFKAVGDGATLAAGSMAEIGRKGTSAQLYLFFSSSCPHCEEVIATLDAGMTCNIRFNPVEKVGALRLPGVLALPSYQTEVNGAFLKSLAIEEIPVLLAESGREMTILRGKQRILAYIAENCRKATVPDATSGTSPARPSADLKYGQPATQDESCSVNNDCPEPIPSRTDGR